MPFGYKQLVCASPPVAVHAAAPVGTALVTPTSLASTLKVKGATLLAGRMNLSGFACAVTVTPASDTLLKLVRPVVALTDEVPPLIRMYACMPPLRSLLVDRDNCRSKAG